MNERRKQMAQEQTGKAIPREQAQKEWNAYKKRLEQCRKTSQGAGELKTTEADERALDKAWEKMSDKQKADKRFEATGKGIKVERPNE